MSTISQKNDYLINNNDLKVSLKEFNTGNESTNYSIEINSRIITCGSVSEGTKTSYLNRFPFKNEPSIKFFSDRFIEINDSNYEESNNINFIDLTPTSEIINKTTQEKYALSYPKKALQAVITAFTQFRKEYNNENKSTPLILEYLFFTANGKNIFVLCAIGESKAAYYTMQGPNKKLQELKAFKISNSFKNWTISGGQDKDDMVEIIEKLCDPNDSSKFSSCLYFSMNLSRLYRDKKEIKPDEKAYSIDNNFMVQYLLANKLETNEE